MARKSAMDAVKAEADRYAANVLPIIREAKKAGARTLREIADALNARGIATARGGQWYAQSVANVPHARRTIGFLSFSAVLRPNRLCAANLLARE
jgi:hypothetical protein